MTRRAILPLLVLPMLLSVVLLSVVGPGAALAQEATLAIISRSTAQRHGLRRAWLTQVELSRAQDRVANVVYYISDPPPKDPDEKPPGGAAKPKGVEILNPGKQAPAAAAVPLPSPDTDTGTLYVQSRRGLLHAIDAETGRTLWVTQVGSRQKPNEAPAVNDQYVAVINGETLYVLDRRDGGLVFHKEVSDVPSAGLAISADWVFVPMLSGEVVAYQLPDVNLRAVPLTAEGPEGSGASASPPDEPGGRKTKLRGELRDQYAAGRIPTMSFRSFAPVTVPPLVTRDRLFWTSRRGRVYIAQKDRAQVNNRFDALREVTVPLTYGPPHVYAASQDGFVYALDERSGQAKWQYSVGEPLYQPPMPLDDTVFAIAGIGGMYCLDSLTGEQRWRAPQIRSFLAASATRLYVADRTGAMQVLDHKSGARVDSLRIDRLDVRVINSRSDRIFVGTHTGVLQCLHETGQDKPRVHAWPSDSAPLLPAKPAAKPKP